MRANFLWLTLAACAALSACAGDAGPFRVKERYHALGHNPGWLLTMEGNRVRFVTGTPNFVFEGLRPLAETTTFGRRYSMDLVTLDISSEPCNDARSGIAFSDTVVVTTDGNSYRGCGGERVPLLDR